MARLRPWLSTLRHRPYGAADARLASGGWLGPAGWDWLPTGLLRKVSKTTSYPPLLSFPGAMTVYISPYYDSGYVEMIPTWTIST